MVPVLTNALQDPVAKIRVLAEKALRRIQPAAIPESSGQTK